VDAASTEALARLDVAIVELSAAKTAPLLHRATAALAIKDWRLAADLALEALSLDERIGLAWHILAIARDKVGDVESAIQCYESALTLSADQADIANDLGHLAYRLGMKPLALSLFAAYRAARPDCIQGLNSQACAQRDAQDYDASIETLRVAITTSPHSPLLWNTLGTVLAEQGDLASARTFFDEALRLDPAYIHARYNLAHVDLYRGDLHAALENCDAALARAEAPGDLAMIRLARSAILLCAGRIGEGWDAYEARLDPCAVDVTAFAIDRPRWTPRTCLEGKSLLLFGEQGLGDEVMFANLLPDVVEALGPKGRLTLAVEPRLVSLFQRSFPDAWVGGHEIHRIDGHAVRRAPFITDPETIDIWAPIATPLRKFRRSVEAYPSRIGYLAADPSRVAHWRNVLATRQGLKVGVLWKSLKLDGVRRRYFLPFEQWRPVLETPGVSFVNLQYGDCQAELDQARESLGLEIWQPPGIDLKDDLDDVAALCMALDLVLGPATATTNLAAAVGGAVWMIGTPGAWPLLGTDRNPWYPQMRVFIPDGFSHWPQVMQDVADALSGMTSSGALTKPRAI
jgi:tetratricopeptide (TPR) repeat protein